MSRKQTLGKGLVLVVAGGITASLLAMPASAQGEAAPKGVTWGECPEDVITAPIVLQCASIKVPLDYQKPDGEQIDVAISRLASTNPAKRRGILLTNPGGPGGPGLSLPADLSKLGAPQSVLDSYDVIGMDTRGVGHSTPMSCGFTNEQEYWANVPPYAVDAAAVRKQAKVAKGVAEQCAAADTKDQLKHLSTANIARDLDQVRAALGEEKASYLGYSYGSALGAAYASLFPERTDRVVLDSNLGDTALDRPGLRRFGLGTEQAFPVYAKWLAARHGSYELGRTAAQVRKSYFSVAEKLDKQPVAGVDGELFRMAIFGSLYNERRWAQTAQIWQDLKDGDHAAVAKAKAELDTPSPNDNAFTGFLSVTCNDVDWSENIADYQRAVKQDRERYPLFGAAAANITPCAYWTHEPSEPKVAISDEGPANILLTQNLRDPATPHRGGELYREKFGDRSRLVSVDGTGHGVYVFGDNPCALNVTTKFLVNGKFPARDVECDAASGLTLNRESRELRSETLDRLDMP